MRWLRSVAAIVAGLGFMTSTVMVGTIVATPLFLHAGHAGPAGPAGAATSAGTVSASVPVGFLVAMIIVSAAGAVLGGWLAARIGTFAPFGHAAALALVVAVLSVVSTPADPRPTWYRAAVAVVDVAGVLLGGKLRAAASGSEAW